MYPHITKFSLFYLAISACLIATVASSDAQQDGFASWSMMGRDFQNSGRVPYVGPEKYDFPTERVRFAPKFFGNVQSELTIDKDGTVYVASYIIEAFYPNGTKKWSLNLQPPQLTTFIYATPALTPLNDTICFGISEAYCINRDAKVVWRNPLARNTFVFDVKPALNGDLFITDPNCVWHFDAQGQVVAKLTPRDYRVSPPAFSNDGKLSFGEREYSVEKAFLLTYLTISNFKQGLSYMYLQ